MIEPADIVRLLQSLAREHADPTCHALHAFAQHDANILNTCYEAIRVLANEKAGITRIALSVSGGTSDWSDDVRSLAA